MLELAGRLGPPAGAGTGASLGRPGAAPLAAPWRDQVRAGLVNLGWPVRDADQAIAAVAADLAEPADGAAAPADQVDVAVALRAALRKLSRA